ncbi:MAG: arsenic resistance N-acetyltransferase ArsN2 [Cyclobacteriaceae bacterium]
MTPTSIKTETAFIEFKDRLGSSKLPHEDLALNHHLLFGYYNQNEMNGTGGLEIYGKSGLIRSVSVDESLRGKQWGTKITLHLIDTAKENHLTDLYLLTETAKDFFLKMGFRIISRAEASEDVKKSAEFRHVCPDSAVCMHLNLNPKC